MAVTAAIRQIRSTVHAPSCTRALGRLLHRRLIRRSQFAHPLHIFRESLATLTCPNSIGIIVGRSPCLSSIDRSVAYEAKAPEVCILHALYQSVVVIDSQSPNTSRFYLCRQEQHWSQPLLSPIHEDPHAGYARMQTVERIFVQMQA